MAWVPPSCTLPTAERPVRVAEFDALLAVAVRPAERLGPTRLRIHLPGGPNAETTTRDLVARETLCCSFFAFDVRSSATATVLEVQVPDEQVEVLDALQQRAGAAVAGA
jgi:hypothetical protein